MNTAEFCNKLIYLATQRSTLYENTFPFNCGYIFEDARISFDCIGLVKSLINDPSISERTAPAGFYVTPGQVIPDTNEIGILNLCTNVAWGNFSGMAPGEYLYMSGHGGVYIGDQGDVNVVECTAAWRGGVLCSWVDEDGTRRSCRGGAPVGRWEAHGRLSQYIDYSGGWRYEDGRWFYYEGGQKKTGWVKDDDEWYLLGSDGAMLIGWQVVGDLWYYFQTEYDGTHLAGEMRTGWLNDSLYKGWFYLDGSGQMKTGWHKDTDGRWYFLQPEFDGAHAKGIMRTGWIEDSGNWYYLAPNENDHKIGEMLTGWVLDPDYDGWFFLDQNGKMQTGWLQDHGSWYYLRENSPKGKMATGWQTINGKTYYFDDNGKMVTGIYEIDGNTYEFDQDGSLIKITNLSQK